MPEARAKTRQGCPVQTGSKGRTKCQRSSGWDCIAVLDYLNDLGEQPGEHAITTAWLQRPRPPFPPSSLCGHRSPAARRLLKAAPEGQTSAAGCARASLWKQYGGRERTQEGSEPGTATPPTWMSTGASDPASSLALVTTQTRNLTCDRRREGVSCAMVEQLSSA